MSALSVATSLAKQFEGCELAAYQDPVGIWTIGYGITHYPDGSAVQQGDTISQSQAEELLSWRMGDSVAAVQRICIKGTANQIGAFGDLSFNIGTPAFMGSTALKRFLNGDIVGAADAMLWWDKAHVDGQLVTLPGLARRRAAEKVIFLTPE